MAERLPFESGLERVPPPFLESFAIADSQREGVIEKLYLIRECGMLPEFWTDCDHTLTEDGKSLWTVMSGILSAPLLAESKAERGLRLAQESSEAGLDMNGHIAWSENEIERHKSNRSTVPAIQAAIKNGVQLRRGVQGLFARLRSLHIESHVLSGNLRVAIEALGLVGAQIHANEVRLNRNKSIIGWRQDRMVHSWTKSTVAEQVLRAAGIKKAMAPKVILGDSLHDRHMLPPSYMSRRSGVVTLRDDKVLRIRTMQNNGNTVQYLRDSLEPVEPQNAFDMVLRTESLEPMIELFDWLAAKDELEVA